MYALFRYILLLILVATLLYWGLPYGQSTCSNTLDADLILLSGACPVFVEGMGGVERDKIDSRWGYGPETKLSFILANEGNVYLHYCMSNPIPGQAVEIFANGNLIKQYTEMPSQSGLSPWVAARIVFKGKTGINTVVFRYNDWNHKSSAFAHQDSRPLAIAFTTLQLLAK